MRQDSIVDIATCYRLDHMGIASQLGQNFLHLSWLAVGANPASYTMGIESFLGGNQLGCGIKHPPPSSTKAEETVEQYLYSLSAFTELQGELYLFMT